jgi:hypothetical protein
MLYNIVRSGSKRFVLYYKYSREIGATQYVSGVGHPGKHSSTPEPGGFDFPTTFVYRQGSRQAGKT